MVRVDHDSIPLDHDGRGVVGLLGLDDSNIAGGSRLLGAHESGVRKKYTPGIGSGDSVAVCPWSVIHKGGITSQSAASVYSSNCWVRCADLLVIFVIRPVVKAPNMAAVMVLCRCIDVVR